MHVDRICVKVPKGNVGLPIERGGDGRCVMHADGSSIWPEKVSAVAVVSNDVTARTHQVLEL
jgi:hypothetical protein